MGVSGREEIHACAKEVLEEVTGKRSTLEGKLLFYLRVMDSFSHHLSDTEMYRLRVEYVARRERLMYGMRLIQHCILDSSWYIPLG